MHCAFRCRSHLISCRAIYWLCSLVTWTHRLQFVIVGLQCVFACLHCFYLFIVIWIALHWLEVKFAEQFFWPRHIYHFYLHRPNNYGCHVPRLKSTRPILAGTAHWDPVGSKYCWPQPWWTGIVCVCVETKQIYFFHFCGQSFESIFKSCVAQFRLLVCWQLVFHLPMCHAPPHQSLQ